MVAHEVVEAVGGIGVDEAVTNPLTGANSLVNSSDMVNGSLNTVLISLAIVVAVDIILAGVAKNIEGFLAGKRDQLSRLGPVDLRRCY